MLLQVSREATARATRSSGSMANSALSSDHARPDISFATPPMRSANSSESRRKRPAASICQTNRRGWRRCPGRAFRSGRAGSTGAASTEVGATGAGSTGAGSTGAGSAGACARVSAATGSENRASSTVLAPRPIRCSTTAPMPVVPCAPPVASADVASAVAPIASSPAAPARRWPAAAVANSLAPLGENAAIASSSANPRSRTRSTKVSCAPTGSVAITSTPGAPPNSRRAQEQVSDVQPAPAKPRRRNNRAAPSSGRLSASRSMCPRTGSPTANRRPRSSSADAAPSAAQPAGFAHSRREPSVVHSHTAVALAAWAARRGSPR